MTDDDIRERAREAYRESPIKVLGDIEAGALTMHFAKAMRAVRDAERARCARIAEEIGAAYGDDETGWLDCTETVAKQIRSSE